MLIPPGDTCSQAEEFTVNSIYAKILSLLPLQNNPTYQSLKEEHKCNRLIYTD